MRRLDPRVHRALMHAAGEIEQQARSDTRYGLALARWTFSADDLLHVLERHDLAVERRSHRVDPIVDVSEVVALLGKRGLIVTKTENTRENLGKTANLVLAEMISGLVREWTRS